LWTISLDGAQERRVAEPPQRCTTLRDGAGARVVAAYREEAPTAQGFIPRHKRYTINLDLDAVAPPDCEFNAPRAPLDL
jgi:hypothetical protein